MKPTSPAYIGIYLLPDSIGVSDLIINFFALQYRSPDNNAASKGVISHDIVMLPIYSQLTDDQPKQNTEKPAIAPIIACVVDTGNPKTVANNNHAPAAVSYTHLTLPTR